MSNKKEPYSTWTQAALQFEQSRIEGILLKTDIRDTVRARLTRKLNKVNALLANKHITDSTASLAPAVGHAETVPAARDTAASNTGSASPATILGTTGMVRAAAMLEVQPKPEGNTIITPAPDADAGSPPPKVKTAPVTELTAQPPSSSVASVGPDALTTQSQPAKGRGAMELQGAALDQLLANRE